jgi:hypothetical protein
VRQVWIGDVNAGAAVTLRVPALPAAACAANPAAAFFTNC